MKGLFSQRRFYDLVAPAYALGQRLLPMWRRYAEQVLPWLPPTGTVLEIGPGPGMLLEKLAGRHPLAVGLDLSPAMLRQAQQRLRQRHRPTHLARGEATRLPFAAESFDGIAATFTLSAIPDGAAAVGEMARVLRPAGVLALVDAAYPDDSNRLGTALAKLWELGGDSMHDAAALMLQAGLDVVLHRAFGVGHGIHLVVGRKRGPGVH